MTELRHDPVMLAEVLAYLDPEPGDVIVDATLGLAGHAKELAQRITPGGTLVGTDWDESMLAEASKRLREVQGLTLHLVHRDYRAVSEVLAKLGLQANGILMDLGLNSAQIDDPERGISFLREGPLEMRMDRSKGEPASAWLNRATPDEIEDVLFRLGDERWARAIARKIVEIRRETPLRTTEDLIAAILAAVPPGARDKRIHPATRSFQAIRIYINQELDGLDEAVRGAAQSLAESGCLVVLSYHSGEDREVKKVFRELSEQGFTELTRKPEGPSAAEVSRNPRSRSAKLRALRRGNHAVATPKSSRERKSLGKRS